MGRGSGAAADFGLIGSSASTPRKAAVLRAMLAARAYEGTAQGATTDGFFALWALTTACHSSFLPEELKLPDSRYSGALASLESDGFVESKFIGEKHLLWRLTKQGVAAALSLASA